MSRNRYNTRGTYKSKRLKGIKSVTDFLNSKHISKNDIITIGPDKIGNTLFYDVLYLERNEY